MAQKFVAEADTLVRALDETRGISATVTRAKSGYSTTPIIGSSVVKGIGRNLGMRVGEAREERRFTRVGITDKPRVGDRFQLELELASLAFLAVLVTARRLVGGRLEIHVAATTATTVAEDEFIARLGQVGDGLEDGEIFRHAGEIVGRLAALAEFIINGRPG